MKNNEMNFNKLLEVLRQSKPEIRDHAELTARIMSEIKREESSVSMFESATEYLFAWVYIGWVRRTMAAAVLVLIAFFAYEQTVIVKRINQLTDYRNQNIMYYNTKLQSPGPQQEEATYTDPGRMKSGYSDPEKEIDDMVRKVRKLREEYKDLFYLIENDPRIRQLVEEKLNDVNPEKK